jgi:hypothetical protein
MLLSVFCVQIFSIFYYAYEGMAFIPFVQNPLYPKGNNALKDEEL